MVFKIHDIRWTEASLECPSCRVDREEMIIDTQLVLARFDRYPVSKGHPSDHPKTVYHKWFEDQKEEEESDP